MGGGTLYVVATPIGNLGDVTLRALEVLRQVPLIAAEDTRVTRRLLARHGIATRTVSFHAHSSRGALEDLLGHLRGGADLALVTDAGTPGVSDPGDELVAAWAAEGGPVVALPGASAVLAAVTASAIAGPRWSFEGFLPRAGRARRERLARIAADDRATVLFEAPLRLRRTIRELVAACGEGRPAAICRELTKLHEQVVRAPLGELAEALEAGRIPERGEVVIVIAGATAGAAAHSPGDAEAQGAALEAETARVEAARVEVERLVTSGLSRAAAARSVAAATGLPRRQLYRRDPGRRLG